MLSTVLVCRIITLILLWNNIVVSDVNERKVKIRSHLLFMDDNLKVRKPGEITNAPINSCRGDIIVELGQKTCFLSFKRLDIKELDGEKLARGVG